MFLQCILLRSTFLFLQNMGFQNYWRSGRVFKAKQSGGCYEILCFTVGLCFQELYCCLSPILVSLGYKYEFARM